MTNVASKPVWISALVAFVMWCGLTGLAFSAAEPVAAYIKADATELKAAFGPELSARILSDALTWRRVESLRAALSRMPGRTCQIPLLTAMTTIYPLASKNGTKSWAERFLVGCDRDVYVQLVVMFDGSAVTIETPVPGDSVASVQLQVDTLPAVKSSATLTAPKDCQDILVVDSVIVKEPELDGKTAWQERWTVSACSKISDYDINFIPNPADGGTTIRVHAVLP